VLTNAVVSAFSFPREMWIGTRFTATPGRGAAAYYEQSGHLALFVTDLLAGPGVSLREPNRPIIRVIPFTWSTPCRWQAPTSSGCGTSRAFRNSRPTNCGSRRPVRIRATLQPVTSESENNGSISQANDVALATWVTGTILPVGDYDFYRFYINAPGLVRITHTEVRAPLLSELWVYNASYGQIGYRRTTNPGETNILDLQMIESGYYYARLHDQGDNDATNAPYRLRIEHTPIVDPLEPNNDFASAPGWVRPRSAPSCSTEAMRIGSACICADPGPSRSLSTPCLLNCAAPLDLRRQL